MAKDMELKAIEEYFQCPAGGLIFKNQIPSIKTADGKLLKGVATVARHLSHNGKFHSDLSFEDQAAVEQWLEYRRSQVDSSGLHGVPISQILRELNCYLADKVFFVTHHPTLADIFLYHGLHGIITSLTFQDKEKYIHLSRWFDNIQQDARLRQNLELLKFSRTPLYMT